MPTNPTNRNEWIFGNIKSPLDDKAGLIRQAVIQMLNKTSRMFKYKNLPETMPQRDLEILLQVNGFAVLPTEGKGRGYAFYGGLGGEPSPYYLPTKAVVANPALRLNETYEIGKNCVIVRNDEFYQSLLPLFNKYATLLVEAELSLKYSIFNARIPAITQADNDNTKASAEAFFKKIVNGEDYSIVATKEFFEGLTSVEFCKQTYIKDLIEAIQYIRGTWYNEIGLNAAFNMKREAINEAEATLNEEILFPYIDTMLLSRQRDFDLYNEMTDSNIKVELDGVWERNQKQEDLSLEQQVAEIENLQQEEDSNEGNGDTDKRTES